MAFNAAANLLLPQWGATAGRNIRENQMYAREEDRRNQLAELLPQAYSGDQNALNMLAQASPDAYISLQNNLYQRGQAAQKLKREDTELKRGRFFDATAGALAAVAQLPQDQQEAAWAQHEARIMKQYRDFVDQQPDTWETARGFAPQLASMDKRYGDLLGRYGLIPQEPEKAKTPPLENWQNADGSINQTILAAEEQLRRAGAPSTVTYGAPMPALDAQGNPVLIQGSNRGGVQVVPGVKPAPSASGSKVSEDQAKAAGWLAQAMNAYKNAEDVLAKNPGADRPNVGADVLGAIPLVGEAARNAALTPAQQQYQQAMSSFSEAALRAATGAGVNRDEAAQKIKELTPQIGDSKAVREQKRASLMVYLDSLKTRAGPAGEGIDLSRPSAVPDDIAAIIKKHGAK